MSSMSRTRSSRSLGGMPAIRSGTPTFSAADRIGMRPNDWKMNATDVRRSRIRSCSDMAVTSWSATRTLPLSGRSSPPTMLSSVVLPEPDRPRSATSWPASHGEGDAAQRVGGGAPAAEGPGDPLDRQHGGGQGGARQVALTGTPRDPRGPAVRRVRAGPARRRYGRARPRAGPGRACRAARSSRAAAAAARPGRAPRTRRRACAAWLPSTCRCVSVLVRPSLIAMTRRTTPDTAGSCVTISTVTPSSALAFCSALNTSAAVTVSSSPVGSSASSTLGLLTSATAMAARCCSPPDIWSGLRFLQSPRPSSSSSSAACVRRALAPPPARRIGSSTFCCAVR